MKTQEQIDARDRKELAQRKKQKNKKALKYGLLLTLLALFLASVTDEISSAIGVQVQSSVVTEFFVRPLNVPYNEAMAMFSTATTFSYALMALVPFYKALADKFGRKPFLVLNTLGMGVGMASAWWSPNMVLYFIGYGMTVFFVQHDMQIVYLYEIVPKERRATIYGLIKGISTLGVVLIPMLRSSVMGTDTTLWRGVYSIFLLALAYEWDIHKQSPKKQASFVEALRHFPVNDAASGLLLHYVSRSFPVYFLALRAA